MDEQMDVMKPIIVSLIPICVMEHITPLMLL